MVWIRQVFQGLNLLSVGTWSINIEVFARCRLQKLQPDNSFKEESFPKTQLPPINNPNRMLAERKPQGPRSLGMCGGHRQGREFSMLV